MALTFVGSSNVTSAANNTTASVTKALPTGTASGDRVYTLQSHNCVAGSAATPTGWTALYKDQTVGTGTPAAGTGARYISCYYRDYDGVWTMPASWDLVSATNNGNSVGGFTVRAGAGETLDTPTYTTADNYGTPTTAFSATTPTFTTVTGAMLLVHVTANDPLAVTAQGISGTNGLTTGTLTEWQDGGTASGTIRVSFHFYVASVTAAASPPGTVTVTSTFDAASEGGLSVIQQTVTAAPSTNTGRFFGIF